MSATMASANPSAASFPFKLVKLQMSLGSSYAAIQFSRYSDLRYSDKVVKLISDPKLSFSESRAFECDLGVGSNLNECVVIIPCRTAVIEDYIDFPLMFALKCARICQEKGACAVIIEIPKIKEWLITGIYNSLIFSGAEGIKTESWISFFSTRENINNYMRESNFTIPVLGILTGPCQKILTERRSRYFRFQCVQTLGIYRNGRIYVKPKLSHHVGNLISKCDPQDLPKYVYDCLNTLSAVDGENFVLDCDDCYNTLVNSVCEFNFIVVMTLCVKINEMERKLHNLSSNASFHHCMQSIIGRFIFSNKWIQASAECPLICHPLHEILYEYLINIYNSQMMQQRELSFNQLVPLLYFLYCMDFVKEEEMVGLWKSMITKKLNSAKGMNRNMSVFDLDGFLHSVYSLPDHGQIILSPEAFALIFQLVESDIVNIDQLLRLMELASHCPDSFRALIKKPFMRLISQCKIATNLQGLREKTSSSRFPDCMLTMFLNAVPSIVIKWNVKELALYLYSPLYNEVKLPLIADFVTYLQHLKTIDKSDLLPLLQLVQKLVGMIRIEESEQIESIIPTWIFDKEPKVAAANLTEAIMNSTKKLFCQYSLSSSDNLMELHQFIIRNIDNPDMADLLEQIVLPCLQSAAPLLNSDRALHFRNFLGDLKRLF